MLGRLEMGRHLNPLRDWADGRSVKLVEERATATMGSSERALRPVKSRNRTSFHALIPPKQFRTGMYESFPLLIGSNHLHPAVPPHHGFFFFEGLFLPLPRVLLAVDFFLF